MGLVIEDSRDGGNGYARLRGEVADCRALAAQAYSFCNTYLFHDVQHSFPAGQSTCLVLGY